MGGSGAFKLCYHAEIVKAMPPPSHLPIMEFILDPKPKYFDPVTEMFPESDVERRLEHMFSCDLLVFEDE